MNFRTKKIIFNFLFFFFLLSCGGFAFAADENTTVINIESADSSKYGTNETDGTDEILLSGNVSVSVEKGETKLSIKADEITYNRTTEILFARGNVELVQTGTSAGEQTISATTLLVNTSTLEGIFDNGRAIHTQSDALNLPSGSTLIVASRVFGRDSSSTIAFKKGELTFCDDENPHWKIRASRIWLLPGGEFAFLNAVISIGHVPVLYLPAFYYPKDELIFNPSFGYKERHGYYFQTTTYILGRKPLEENDVSTSSESKSSSAEELTKGIFNFMKPSVLKEQKREGLVLHNLDEDYTGDTSHYLKIIGDYYSNLGAMVGIDGVFAPSNEYVSSVSASMRLGFTNTVFYSGVNYIPYSSEGKKFKDSGNFMGIRTPYRYGINFKADVSKPVDFHLTMPILSDPFFTEDFDSRSESLDWISFFMNNNSKEKSDEEDTSTQTTSFTWNANASFNIPLPDFVYPYIKSARVSNVSSSLIFNAKFRNSDDADWASKPADWAEKTPERAFFYPSQVTPLKISGKIEGVLYQYPHIPPKSSKTPEYVTPLNIPEEFLTEEQIAERKKKNEEAENENENENEKEKEKEKDSAEDVSQDEKNAGDEQEEKFTFTELELQNRKSVVDINDGSYSLSYEISPQYISQLNYDATKLVDPEDFSWSDLYSSYYQFQLPSTLSSSLKLKDDFASFSNSVTFNPLIQKHPNLDGYSESSKKSVILSDYKAKKMDLTNSNNVAFKPFRYTDYFKDTGLEWNSTIRLLKTQFVGDAENPEWEYMTADLTDEECMTVHTMSAILSAKENDFSQTFTMTFNLPPQTDEYNGTLTFGFPHFSTTATTGLYKKSKEENDFIWNPFKQSATLKLFDDRLSITESYNYELEERYKDSFKLSAAYKNLQLAYTMQWTTVYDLEKDRGWVAKKDKEFVPYNFSISYATQNKTYRYWRRRITWAPALSSSLVYDCVRPTNSYFRFVPSISFKIHDQFELTFSSESQNNVIFRYIQDYAGYEDAIGGEKNVFKDLYNSFVFWGNGEIWDGDQTNRKGSGFKIKNFKISVKRILHDWSLEGNVTFKPRYVTASDGRKEFDYHPYITFAVSWHPMPSMKTNLVDDYGTWSLNP